MTGICVNLSQKICHILFRQIIEVLSNSIPLFNHPYLIGEQKIL
jgi:hypothetical protein